HAIFFTLKGINIEGVTAFTQQQISELYASFIGKEVPLDFVWLTAESITDRYHSAGYFLSRAYVPQQAVKDGTFTIKVVEGYVGAIELPENMQEYHVIREYRDRLLAKKPVKATAIERFLLQMNDLPGVSFRAVLSPLEGGEEGAVKLTLEPAEK